MLMNRGGNSLVRIVIMLLTFAIVFLIGMLFGVNNHEEAQESSHATEELTDQDPSIHKLKFSKEEANDHEKKDENNHVEPKSKQFTHKTAAFLEKGVIKFYDFVVETMYKFSKVFF